MRLHPTAPVPVLGQGTERRQSRSSRGHPAWQPGEELGGTAGVPTPWQGLGGFSAAPARDVAAFCGCTSGCTSGCASTSPAAVGAEGPARRPRAPLNPEKSATWERVGPGRAGGDRPGSCPNAVAFPAAAAGISPSRGEGVKIQAPSRLKRWTGREREAQRAKAQKAFVRACAEWAFSLPVGKSEGSSAGLGCTPLRPHVPHGAPLQVGLGVPVPLRVGGEGTAPELQPARH